MRTTAKLFSLALISLFLMSGCASTEEKVQSPGELAVAEAVAANNAAKAAGNEWRDTGKLLKYAQKALDDGKEDKAILLANKAKRQAGIALGQANYEDEKFLNSLSDSDRAALADAEAAINQIKADEMKSAMAAQADAAKADMAAEAAPSQQSLSTTRSTTGSGEDSYTVVGGDSLWGIAGKDSVYSNSYQWPLIYKANRSKIKDADLIYPGQNFDIDRGASAAEIDAAVNHAKTRGAWSVGDVEQSDLDYLNK